MATHHAAHARDGKESKMSRKGAPGALAARPTEQEQDKGRVDQTRVKRYWAGKAPEWASAEQQIQELQLGGAEAAGREVVRTEVAAPVIVQRKADPRLARLAATRSEDLERMREEHREIRAAEVVRRRRRSEEDEQPSSEEPEQRRRQDEEEEEEEEEQQPQQQAQQQEQEEDEEEADRRRQAVRERLREQQRALEAAQQQEEDEEEEEEDESEYETDSEDEGGSRKLLKPVFVPKQARETIAEREQMEAEEEALREYEKTRQAERKVETRELVKTVIEAEEAAARAAAEEASRGVGALADVVTDDEEADESTEFEAWKQRELARVRRDREAKQRHEREAAERERLRNMTDEERRAWELANPKQHAAESKKKWKFMQKYWHKGAFFQEAADDDQGTTEKLEILERDFSAPTGEDKWINKELLPKVMQVRNFGRSGRTKWTHLLAEDTTQVADAAPLLPASGDRKRQGGYGGDQEAFAKPKKFRT